MHRTCPWDLLTGIGVYNDVLSLAEGARGQDRTPTGPRTACFSPLCPFDRTKKSDPVRATVDPGCPRCGPQCALLGRGSDGTIDIERERTVARAPALEAQRKALLIVLFVPSVDRESERVDQDSWTRRSLEFLGKLFGGATAFPKAQGVWRDDEREGRLVWDEPVIVHCYAAVREMKQRANQVALGVCREMGRSTNQGEVGLIIDNVYHAVRPE